MTTKEATAEPQLARMQNTHVESVLQFDLGASGIVFFHAVSIQRMSFS